VPTTSVHARFRPTHLSGQTHVCKWGCHDWKRVASERAKRTFWLVAATKLVCSLLPGLLCGWAALRSPAEIIGKKCDNRQFANGGRAFYEQCCKLARALFSSRNRLHTLIDAILLLDGRCHVGHKNANRLHAHGSACTLVADTQDVALLDC